MKPGVMGFLDQSIVKHHLREETKNISISVVCTIRKEGKCIRFGF